DKVIGSFSTAAPLSTMGETELFLFLGYKVPLMPMAGSVYLAELEKISSKKNILFIMINKEAAGGVHFSLRGTDPAIHAGKICANLSARLVEKYGNKDEITGGGHFVAAECKTRNSGVTLSESLEVFAKMMMDMEGLSGETGSEEGISLGLEYLAEK
ncbi:MAG: hypothetical protein GX817_00965, partial [Elusimicrobia bacterium]|nr:hypothetical protein [Elusimicrobiota bacterium]